MKVGEIIKLLENDDWSLSRTKEVIVNLNIL